MPTMPAPPNLYKPFMRADKYPYRRPVNHI
jgi:hypothetical protein